MCEEKSCSIISQTIAEIERHKWFISERMGTDVGGNLAAMDFLLNHYERWLDQSQGRYSSN